MHQHSSSTSSSERRGGAREVVLVGLWMLAALAVVDAIFGLTFPMPENPRDVPSQLARFFDYGTSIEGKVRRYIGATDETTSLLAWAGWFEGAPDMPTKADTAAGHDILVTCYGMSFHRRACNAMAKQDGHLSLRKRLGPGASLTHSYSFYLKDRAQFEGKVVVLGILASSLEAVGTTTHMTWNVEGPAPHMYPRYYLDDAAPSGLRSVPPPVRSLEQMRAALADPDRWAAVEAHIEAHDDYYDPLLFDAGPSDRSVLLRAARRAYAHDALDSHRRRIYDPRHGFEPDTDVARLAKALLTDFVRQVRADDRIPIVVFYSPFGWADHAEKLLGPTLDAEKVAYLSSHRFAPPSVPATFAHDSHFLPEYDVAIGNAILEQVNLALGRK